MCKPCTTCWSTGAILQPMTIRFFLAWCHALSWARNFSHSPHHAQYLSSAPHLFSASDGMCVRESFQARVKGHAACTAGAIWVAGVSVIPYWVLRMLGFKKAVGLICTRLVLVSNPLHHPVMLKRLHACSHA